MTEQYAEQLHRMLADAGTAPCTLCGRRPVVQVGIWFPTTPVALQALGLPEGTTRLFVHGLCAVCAAQPVTAAAAVERKIVQSFASRN